MIKKHIIKSLEILNNCFSSFNVHKRQKTVNNLFRVWMPTSSTKHLQCNCNIDTFIKTVFNISKIFCWHQHLINPSLLVSSSYFLAFSLIIPRVMGMACSLMKTRYKVLIHDQGVFARIKKEYGMIKLEETLATTTYLHLIKYSTHL